MRPITHLIEDLWNSKKGAKEEEGGWDEDGQTLQWRPVLHQLPLSLKDVFFFLSGLIQAKKPNKKGFSLSAVDTLRKQLGQSKTGLQYFLDMVNRK